MSQGGHLPRVRAPEVARGSRVGPGHVRVPRSDVQSRSLEHFPLCNDALMADRVCGVHLDAVVPAGIAGEEGAGEGIVAGKCREELEREIFYSSWSPKYQ